MTLGLGRHLWDILETQANEYRMVSPLLLALQSKLMSYIRCLVAIYYSH